MLCDPELAIAKAIARQDHHEHRCGIGLRIPILDYSQSQPWVHMGPWPVRPWAHGAIGPWGPLAHEAMGAWAHGAMGPWAHGAMGP